MANGLLITILIVLAVAVIAVGLLLTNGLVFHHGTTNLALTTTQTTTIFTNVLATSTLSTISTTSTTTVNHNIGNYSGQQSSLPSCGTNYTLFSAQLFYPNSVLAVLPIADYIPPDHVFPTPHSYIYTDNPATHTSKDGAYFYAPANMVLTTIAIRNLRNTLGVYKNVTDYTLVFQPCEQFDLYFHNVASLIYPPFINASKQLARSCNLSNQTYCQTSVYIPIASGQAIGTIGNQSAGISGLDVGARDYRLATGRSAFIDPNRLCPTYNGKPNVFDRCYAVCPYSYFTQNIQQQIRFSDAYGDVMGTSCGTVYQDVNGTAKGYWFPANNSTSSISPEATDLFLGQDNLQPSLDIFSVGVSVPGLQANRYSFTPSTSGLVNSDFSSVTPGNVYCYQANSLTEAGYATLGSEVIYLQLINSTTLLIQQHNASSCGSSPWVIGPNAAKFIR